MNRHISAPISPWLTLALVVATVVACVLIVVHAERNPTPYVYTLHNGETGRAVWCGKNGAFEHGGEIYCELEDGTVVIPMKYKRN